jgi:hypothetical protein
MRLPNVFYEKHIYTESDFSNEHGVIPTFWDQNRTCSNDGECTDVWGPCYPPNEPTDWRETIDKYANRKIEYLRETSQMMQNNKDDTAGLCRPGFLIIGQGKCGTSSLYHYLMGHPRALDASEKQVHYFRYYANMGMRWYLSHFPTTKSFLSKGGLISGEASPGYLPYPNVVGLAKKEMMGTKIICIGRDPLDRSWSSYRYNYKNPAITAMRNGRLEKMGIKHSQPDDYYEQFLYSFEDMLRAELKVLKECLKPGGIGETGAKELFGSLQWVKDAAAQREKSGLPPLIDLDGQCYGEYINATVPKKQWNDLVRAKPGKFLDVQNIHLSQAMIGRSLYTYPLEWWYAVFPRQDLYFLCTEDMRDTSGEPINQVAQFVGLPSFDFSKVVAAGMYNVGGHEGYDEVTSWKVAEEDSEEQHEHNLEANSTDIPISDEFRQEMLAFFRPHNERLFSLVGRRCNWTN